MKDDHKNIELSSLEIKYAKNNKNKKCDFSLFFDQGLENLRGLTGKKIKKYDIADKLGIQHNAFKTIINRNRPTKQRDCIIAICIVLQLDSEKTNEALDMYNFQILNTECDRDDELINIIEEQVEDPKTIEMVNKRLTSKNFEVLLITGREKSQHDSKKIFITKRSRLPYHAEWTILFIEVQGMETRCVKTIPLIGIVRMQKPKYNK